MIIKTEYGLPFVETVLSHQEKSVCSGKFLIDTGSASTLISAEIAVELGLGPAPSDYSKKQPAPCFGRRRLLLLNSPSIKPLPGVASGEGGYILDLIEGIMLGGELGLIKILQQINRLILHTAKNSGYSLAVF
jgi:hypothetical protein